MTICLRGALTFGLICGAVGCVSAEAPKPASIEKEAVGLVKQVQVLRSIGGETRVVRWHLPGESEALVVQVNSYVSGVVLIKGASLVFHREELRWALSLNGRLLPLDSLVAAQPAPALPAGFQRPVVWQGSFDHLGKSWRLALFKVDVPQTVPGVTTEAEHSLDLLLWQAAVKP